MHALEVKGSFDDCQRLVKEAFRDKTLGARLHLTSANSINIGRLLPQCIYYVFAATRRAQIGGESPTICVPSGNFGNLTAGVYAWRWGLPIRGFIAATNVNDVVPLYLASGRFSPRPSAQTLSNAMDVGNPSNFERLEALFRGDWKDMANVIEGRAVSDARTAETMRRIYTEHGLFVDPHTAVGCAAAWDHLADHLDEQVIVLSTAHPGKFSDIVLQATGATPPLPGKARSLPFSSQAVASCGKVSPRALGVPSEFLRVICRASAPGPGPLSAQLFHYEGIASVALPRFVDAARFVIAFLARV